MGAFKFGFDDQSYDAGDGPQRDPGNPLALGGGIGAQAGSQTGGQGIGGGAMGGTMFSPSYSFGGPDASAGGISGTMPGGLAPGVGGVSGGAMGATMPPPTSAPAATRQGGAVSSSPQTASIATAQRPNQQNMPNFGDMLTSIQNASSPQESAVAKDKLSRELSSSLSNAGHDVKWQDEGTLVVDGRPYTVGGGGVPTSQNNGQLQLPSGILTSRPTGGTANTIGAPGATIAGGAGMTNTMGGGAPGGTIAGGAAMTNTMGGAASQLPDISGMTGEAAQSAQQSMLPSDLASWRPDMNPMYTPGEIGFGDIPEFTRESLLAEMEGGETNQNTNALLNEILKNPTALNDQVVDTLKAQQRNTLAEQQQQEEENMRAFGASSGISDSRWMGNQLAGSQRARDMAVAKGNQDVDIAAANTRMGDKRAAAQLGMQAGQQRAANVQASTNAALARSAATGDRMQLRESVKQAAAQLGISQQQMMSNFVLEKEKNILQKYGIDLGAQIDMAKLNEQSQEFKEDLAFKMQQLEQTMAMQGRSLGQQNDQFGQEMKYKYDVFNEDLNQRDWERRAIQDALGG